MTESAKRIRRNHQQRGIVLAAALILALLYFALMELMMLDASRSLQAAQRYRSQVIAATLAESGAELAAAGMVQKVGTTASFEDGQGSGNAQYKRTGCCNFEITADAKTSGVPEVRATVRLQGTISGTAVAIDYAVHSQ